MKLSKLIPFILNLWCKLSDISNKGENKPEFTFEGLYKVFFWGLIIVDIAITFVYMTIHWGAVTFGLVGLVFIIVIHLSVSFAYHFEVGSSKFYRDDAFVRLGVTLASLMCASGVITYFWIQGKVMYALTYLGITVIIILIPRVVFYANPDQPLGYVPQKKQTA